MKPNLLPLNPARQEPNLPDIEATETAQLKPAPKRKPMAKKPDAVASIPVKAATKLETPVKKSTPAPKKVTAAKVSAASKNGSAKALPKPKAKQASAPPEPPTPMDRAEDKLDELGKVVGSFLAGAAKRLRKAAAIGKEELEDLWAEAQSIRRGDVS